MRFEQGWLPDARLAERLHASATTGSWLAAIVESAVRRFRPITLTAAAAVLALIPLAREVFWAPMALAMMGGLIAATVLTLTFLPALYALAFRVALQPDLDHSNLNPRAEPALQAAE
jgi:multidrug efflux pump